MNGRQANAMGDEDILYQSFMYKKMPLKLPIVSSNNAAQRHTWKTCVQMTLKDTMCAAVLENLCLRWQFFKPSFIPDDNS